MSARKLRSIAALAFAALLLCTARAASAQTGSAWHDDLIDHMAGTWKLEGTMLGKPAHHTVTAEWILNHQFLRLHEVTSADAPASEDRYEAFWFIGYDATSERYAVHLLDIFGGRDSETLGYGTRQGSRVDGKSSPGDQKDNSIALVFEYPDGPFHTTMRWIPESGTWQWHLEQKDKGKWSTFADLTLTPAAGAK